MKKQIIRRVCSLTDKLLQSFQRPAWRPFDASLQIHEDWEHFPESRPTYEREWVDHVAILSGEKQRVLGTTMPAYGDKSPLFSGC